MTGVPQLLSTPAPKATPDIFTQAKTKWPILNNPELVYKYSPKAGSENYLETFPPGEQGDPSEPRPKDFPMDKYGIQVYKSNTDPINVLGDAVVHALRFTDPTVKSTYSQFEKSITPQQEAILRNQYQYYVARGEKRSYQQWRDTSGVTQLFGGRIFAGKQEEPWPADWYTPEQNKMLEGLMKYLSRAK
jgi:hypothetical protein